MPELAPGAKGTTKEGLVTGMQYQSGLENRHELNALHFAGGCSDTLDLVAELGEDESSQVLLPATLSCGMRAPAFSRVYRAPPPRWNPPIDEPRAFATKVGACGSRWPGTRCSAGEWPSAWPRNPRPR